MRQEGRRSVAMLVLLTVLLIAPSVIARKQARKPPPPPPTAPPPPRKGVSAISTTYAGTKTLGLVPASSVSTKLSAKFRYASSGYSSKLGTWTMLPSLDWTLNGAVQRVKDQSTCNASWAFAPVAAIESAVYITTGATAVPSISEQQIIDCQGTGGCQGGWPGDTFEYSARMKLADSTAYSYKAKDKSKACNPTQAVSGGKYNILQYEAVNFRGSIGLLLAVQQSPVIVNIEASQQSFINYGPGKFPDDVYDDPVCFMEGVDHTVTIVGYNLLDPEKPYWLIRNSWGPAWGLSGYMKLKITGGFGICGINSLPGILPIVKGKDGCNNGAWGSKGAQTGAGLANPCGAGTCNPSGTKNKCTNCPADWVASTNLDGSQTCVPASPCSFFAFNPCGVGTCVDSTAGSYTCVCPARYVVGQRSSDNSPKCVRDPLAAKPKSYTVPKGLLIKCSVIYQMYSIRKEKFMKLNPKIDCSKLVPGGKVVNVKETDLQDCSLPYSISKGDNCAKIAKLFGLPYIDGVDSPNPDLDCNNLQVGEQVCIQRGESPEVNLCTNLLPIQPADSCETIVNDNLNGNWTEFYSLNPGIYCDKLSNQQINDNIAMPGEEVCLQATSLARSSYTDNCRSLNGLWFTVPSRPSCPQVISNHYRGLRSVFRTYNNGADCTESLIDGLVGSCLCAPVVPLLKRCNR